MLTGYRLNISANIGSIASTIGASYFAGYRFAIDKSREPSHEEKKQFAIGSLIVMTIIGLLITFVAMQFVPGLFSFAALLLIFKSPIFLGALVLITVIYYFANKYFFGFAAAQKLNRT